MATTSYNPYVSNFMSIIRFYPKTFTYEKGTEINIHKLDITDEMVIGLTRGLNCGNKDDVIFHLRIIKKCNVSPNYQKVISNLIAPVGKWDWVLKKTQKTLFRNV